MNKSALKKFAVEARNALMKQVTARASIFGITKEEIASVQSESSDAMVINGVVHDLRVKKQREDLVRQIREKGFDQVVEEAAYTWFNRFMALRFMEVNDYLPTGTRVLSSIVADRDDPDLLVNCLKVELPIDKEKVYAFQDKNDREGLFRYLLIIQCNELNSILPFMFEPIRDFTDLLMPDNLLYSDSVIRKMVREIPEEDWKEVEVIGWLYQYYISEKKDTLIKAKKAYNSKDIPAVTQLFTPQWIVKYMVENSLGRYWQEARPNRDLQSKWEFYLEPRDEETKKKLEGLKNPDLNPETIKVFDPAMGSGHILTYSFDVLYDIYLACGYPERDIPGLILSKNLYGLDIDSRATQLARFALLMKARQKNRRILREPVPLNLYEIIDTKNFIKEEVEILAGENFGTTFNRLTAFIESFEEAKTLGSIIKVKDYDESFLLKCIERGERTSTVTSSRAPEKMKNLLGQARLLSMKYDICVANPPYMGGKYMNNSLKQFVNQEYPDYKSDLFSAFIKVLMDRTSENGHFGVMSPFVWMFIQSYESMREEIIRNRQITTLIQLEYSGFAEATVPICTFTIRNQISETSGEYIRLSDFRGSDIQPIKTLEAIENPEVSYRHTARSSDFSKIPGSPIAYWVSDRVREVFEEGESIGNLFEVREGLGTRDDDIFLRQFWEVNFEKIRFFDNDKKWVSTDKAGSFRKWYGNFSYVMNWENDGFAIKNHRNLDGSLKSRPQNTQFFFREAVSWNKVGSGITSFRYRNNIHAFNDAAPSIFGDNLKSILAMLNSKVSTFLLRIKGGTLNVTTGLIKELPSLSIFWENEFINAASEKFISIGKSDWDNFETSWNFKKLPLLEVTSEQWTVDSEEKEVTSEQWTVTSEEKEVTSDQWSVTSEGKEVDSEQWTVTSEEKEVDSGQWTVDSKKRSAITGVDINGEKLQGFNGLAKRHGSGHDDLSVDQKLSSGGKIRSDSTTEKSGSIDTQQYSRGTGKELNCGIQEFSLHCEGVTGGSGNSASDISSPGISEGRPNCKRDGSTSANQQNAHISNKQTDHWPLTTDNSACHWPLTTDNLSFIPDKDAIIPVLDDDYFEDDIVARFIDFVRATFGDENLSDNLGFIADSLGRTGNESSQDRIRKYFLTEFYKDHCQKYKKRPIYWMFSSGKKKGFNCLIYLHRYHPGMVAQIRTDYLHELQEKLEVGVNNLNHVLEHGSRSDQVKARKRIAVIEKQQEELVKYDELLRHYADMAIDIDLDDGVKVNYAKFGELMEKVG